MPMLSQPSFGPRTALIYVTTGTLIDVWTLVWYFTRSQPLSPSGQFWVIGLALTGLTLITLGLLLGRLGRSARQAELPPAEVVQAEAAIQQTAAANPAPVAAQSVGAAPMNGQGGMVLPQPAPAAAPAAVPAVPAPPAGTVLTNPQVR
jgi:hypothetical protein